MSSPDQPKPKSNVLTILLGIAVVCMLACCGGGYYFYIKAKDAVEKAVENLAVKDPAKIQEKLNAIVTVEIPPGFAPEVASSIPGIDVQIIAYKTTKTGSEGSLTISQATDKKLLEGQGKSTSSSDTATKPVEDKKPADDKKAEKDDDKKDDDKKDDAKKDDEDEKKSDATGTPDKEETKETTVNGEKASFKIVQKFDADKKLQSTTVRGSFRTKNKSYGMLDLRADADVLTYDQVLKLVESVK